MKLPCIIITDSIKEPGWWYLGVYDEKGALIVRTKGNSREDPYLFIDKLRRATDSDISDNRKEILLRQEIEKLTPPENNFTDGF